MWRCVGLSVTVLAVSLGLARGDDEKTLTVTEKENGGKVKLAKGGLLTVKLAGNPTTGFRWFIAKNAKEELAPQGKGEYAPAQKGLIGGGGTFTFQFRASRVGTSELELVYKRGFEKDKAPAKTFKLKLQVE
jgi:inhibitor of cysteine peptidase